MGTADTVTKAYMRGNAVFADAFNYLIYGGEKVIDAQNLQEVDTVELTLPFVDKRKKGKKYTYAIQKYRDVFKSAVIMQNDNMSYILFGVENQTDVHYAMPVRNMMYDAMQYGKQVTDILTHHRKNRDTLAKHNKGEYLSGFYKDDKIVPVITLVIHFGADKWDGPISLYDMIDIKDEKVKKFIQDYQIYIIDPAVLTETDLLKFSTSLREVLGCIKYSKSKDGLRSFIKDNPRMMMDIEAARVINVITGMEIEISDDKEKINMCEAIEGMMADNRAEVMVNIAERLKSKGMSNEDTAEVLGITEDELQNILNLKKYMSN